MSRKALPCKACVEHPKGTCFAARSDYFRAARRHKNNDIISDCRKSQRLFRQPEETAVRRFLFAPISLFCHSTPVRRLARNGRLFRQPDGRGFPRPSLIPRRSTPPSPPHSAVSPAAAPPRTGTLPRPAAAYKSPAAPSARTGRRQTPADTSPPTRCPPR